MNAELEAIRFWGKVRKTDRCWLWTGSLRHGYGSFRVRGRTILAHHFLTGKPPAGLEFHHLCRERSCVRPDHLEAVTHAENVRRGLSGINMSSKTSCAQGHLFDALNTGHRPTGGRY